MNIKYKVVEVHDSDHVIVVRYYTDLITEEDLVSFRDDNGKIIRCRSDVSITLYDPDASEGDIEQMIINNAPRQWLEILEHAKLEKPSNALDHAKTKLNKETEIKLPDILI
jgi:hypothetical protein